MSGFGKLVCAPSSKKKKRKEPSNQPAGRPASQPTDFNSSCCGGGWLLLAVFVIYEMFPKTNLNGHLLCTSWLLQQLVPSIPPRWSRFIFAFVFCFISWSSVYFTYFFFGHEVVCCTLRCVYGGYTFWGGLNFRTLRIFRRCC